MKKIFVTLCVLFLTACSSTNSVEGFYGERRWYNHSIPAFMQKEYFDLEYANCKSSVRKGFSLPKISINENNVRYSNGQATITHNGQILTAHYSGTVVEQPSFSKGVESGYAIGAAFAAIERLAKAEVDCIEALGWVSVEELYTPFYLNEEINFNMTFMDMVRRGYYHQRLVEGDNTKTYLLNENKSLPSTKMNPAKIHYGVITHNATNPKANTCEIYIKRDRSYAIQCDDGSVASGQKVVKRSVFDAYYKIVEKL
jgi:hypothetical protein